MPPFRSLDTLVPDVLSGSSIPGEWEVVVPVARTNEVLNPSVETGTTGYTTGAGTLARTTTKQYHGAYSLIYTPSAALTDGFYYGTISTVAAQIRAISCKFWGQPNVPYALTFATTAGVDLVTYTFKGQGRWQWIWLYWTETSTTTRRIYFRKNSSNDVHPFYVDGVQSEVIQAGETVSTYIDGDQRGFLAAQFPIPYGWNGTPHASSSYRTALTRAGGSVISFKRYGFVLMAIIGLGLPTVQNVSTEYAQIDGGYPTYTRKPTSQFSIVGNMSEGSYLSLRNSRGGLGRLFDRDSVALDQLLMLRYRHTDDCDNVLSDTGDIPCKYVSGWEGQSNNSNAQTITMTFEQYLPAIQLDQETGASLNVQTSIATQANGVLQRSAAGVWSSMGSVTGGFGVYSIVRGLDGLIYMGGDFTPAPAASVVVWNPLTSTFSALGTGAAGGFVYQLAVMPTGDIIAVGTFTSMGGVANTNKVARWSIASQAWQSISSSFVGTELRCAAVGSNGILYVGGAGFTISGVAVNNVAQYNGSAWSAVGTGIAAGGVTSLLPVGTALYAAVEANGVYRYNGSAWSNIGATSGGDAVSLAVNSRGLVFASGAFTSIGGVSAARIAYYNGVTWFPLGTGLNGSVNTRAMSFDSRGLLYVGGDFTTAGGISTPTGSAVWNGTSWVYTDIIPSGTVHMYGALALPSGQFYQGTINAGSAIAPGITTITNTETAQVYPTITFRGPTSGTSRIYSIINATTGRSIYLNFVINAGETAVLRLQPDAIGFTSDFQGDVIGSILPGSNIADFFLQPGANSIATFSAVSTVTAVLTYRPSVLSLDDLR